MESGGGQMLARVGRPLMPSAKISGGDTSPFRSTGMSGTWSADSLRSFLLWTEFVDSRIQESINWLLIIHHLVSACILVGWASGKCAVLRLELAGYT